MSCVHSEPPRAPRQHDRGAQGLLFVLYSEAGHGHWDIVNGVLLLSWRKRWNRNLLRFLGSRARQPDIEDLAQETYLRLLRAPDLREVRNPQAYLISVASHVLAEWHARQPSADLALDADLPSDRPAPEFEVDVRISQRRMDEVLAALSPMMRAVLLLRLRDDYSSKEISQALDLTPRQVKRLLARGYDMLRRALE